MNKDGLPTEMTEVELATTLPIMDIVDKKIKFKDIEANKIALMRALNEMDRVMNGILDDEMKLHEQKKRLFESLKKEFGR